MSRPSSKRTRAPLLHIGTSGWAYAHWKDRFYPPELAQKKWLEFYSSHFDTVEVNSTFYHMPAAATFAGWKQRTPEGFLFTLKASPG
jgi:uncharacterized protein YecE (DUF72 family)